MCTSHVFRKTVHQMILERCDYHLYIERYDYDLYIERCAHHLYIERCDYHLYIERCDYHLYIERCVHHIYLEWVSDCWLTHYEQFVSDIMTRTSYILLRRWWYPFCNRQTDLEFSWIFIVIAHWNNSPRLDTLHSRHMIMILIQLLFVLAH